MIALWSRATRTPGTCRCISCLVHTSHVTRRSGVSGLKAAWAIGTPTSTFAYTAVFAAGLAIDAKAKQDRNKQWDVAFESLREEMHAREEGEQSHTDSAHQPGVAFNASPIPDHVDWDEVSRAISMDMVDDPIFEQRQTPPDTLATSEFLWELLPSDARSGGSPLLHWPASTGLDPGSRYNLPPQSLWALEPVRVKALRNRHTEKKLAIQEVSVCLLIHHVLSYSKASRAPEDALASLSPHIASVARYTWNESQKHMNSILEDIRRLTTTKMEDWPNDTMSIRAGTKFLAEPKYVQDVDGDFHHIAEQLNAAITHLFDEYYDKRKLPDQMALAAAKICHNLLISSAAPNVQTFNILLTGFRKWEKPGLVDSVIKAMDVCKIRPNEITCVAILDHYTETRRPELFSQFVALMRGANNALMLARPDITVNEAGQGRLIRVSEQKVYQKVYPTPMVFHSLMHGVLQFAGFDRAMDIYYEMKEDGWGLDMIGLSRFLEDCMHRADWQGGLAVWEEIASIKGRIKPDLLTKAYAQFLTLCSVAQKPAAFNSVLTDAIKRGYNRKELITSSNDLIRSVRQKKGYLAPAFTADNLLIAVSDYMKADDSTEAETASFFEEMGVGSLPDDEVTQETASTKTTDAWDAWLQHELGEQPSKK